MRDLQDTLMSKQSQIAQLTLEVSKVRWESYTCAYVWLCVTLHVLVVCMCICVCACVCVYVCVCACVCVYGYVCVRAASLFASLVTLVRP